MSIELPEDHARSLVGDRSKLLDQLRYLMEEAQALVPLLERLPAEVLEMRPPDGWSTKETLGLLADSDQKVFLPDLQRIIADEAPPIETPDEEALVEEASWNEAKVADILETVRERRAETVSFLENLPPEEWGREGVLQENETYSIYELALYIGRHDVYHLRKMSQRMHEANLTQGEDLPK